MTSETPQLSKENVDQPHDNVPATITGLPRSVAAQLSVLGGLRDGILITISAIYVMGYAVWSVNASQNHLGLLPAVQAQYLVAGIVPVSIIVVAYMIGSRWYGFIKNSWPKYVGPDVIGWRRALRRAITVIIVVSSVSYFFGIYAFEFKLIDDNGIFFWIVVGCLTVSYLALIFRPPDFFETILRRSVRRAPTPGQMNRALQFYGRLGNLLSPFQIYYIVAVPLLIGLIVYIGEIYPALPQEFGGAQPRCANLDLVKNDLSMDTLREFVPAVNINSTDLVVRSVNIDIFYSNSDVLLIKLHSQTQSAGLKVYEIRRDAVQIIRSCDTP